MFYEGQVALICGSLAMVGAAMVLLGWQFNITTLKSISSTFIAMKPNSALALFFGGLAVALPLVPPGHWGVRVVAITAASLTTLIGLLTLSEYLISWPSSFDLLLFRDTAAGLGQLPPGRAAPNSALAFILLGSGLLCLRLRPRRAGLIDAAAVSALALAFMSLGGYLLGEHDYVGLGAFNRMALNTTLLVTAVSVGLIDASPGSRLRALAVADDNGGHLFRRLLPVALLVPVLLDLLQKLGRTSGVFGTAFGEVLADSVVSLLMAAMLVRFALQQQRNDARLAESFAIQTESEDKFRYMFDHATVGHSMTSLAGTMQMNEAFCSMLGYSHEELASKNWQDITHPDDIEITQRALDSLLFGNQSSAQFTKRYLRKDGKFIWTQVSTALRRDAQGNPQCFLTSIVDLTKVREAEHYNRSLLEASLDPLVTISAEGKITDVNEATITVTGRCRSELIGSDFADYFSDPQQARAGYEKAFADGSVRDYPLTVLHVSGSTMPVLYNATVYRNAEGEIAGLFAAARDITALKRAQDAAQESARYARSLLEASLDPLVTISAEGKITDVNEATVKATGRCRTDLISSDFTDYFSDPQQARAGYETAFANGSVRDYPLTLRHISGNTTPVLYNATLYKNADGSIGGLFAAARDISSLKRTQDALIRANRALQVLNASDNALLHAEDEAQLIHEVCTLLSNQGGYRLAWVGEPQQDADCSVRLVAQSGQVQGYIEQQHISWNDSELGRGPTGSAIRTGVVQVNRNFTTNPLAAPWREAAQKSGLASSVALPLKEGDKTFACLTLYSGQTDEFGPEEVQLLEELASDLAYGICALRIRKDRDAAEQSLETAHRRLRSFIDANIFGVAIANIDGVVTEANDYYLNLVGYSREELMQGSVDWRTITPPEWASADAQALRELQERGVCTPYEKEDRCRDGSRVWIYQAKALLRGEESQIASFVINITDRKHALQEVQRLNEELEHRVQMRTEQLAAANKDLEGFSYSVSHDLRAPLRAIDSFSNFLLEDYSKQIDAEGKRMLGVLRNNAQKMGHLIDDILAFSRAGRRELTKVPVDMTELFSGVFTELVALCPERHIELQMARLPVAVGDAAALRQVVTNLLSNAIKFTRPRDIARVCVEGHSEEHEKIYTVADNGVGFDSQYKHKLFGVFERLHSAEEFEGSGIGLAIVKRFIAKHGGRVWAESAVGEGATFHFTLPDEPNELAQEVPHAQS